MWFFYVLGQYAKMKKKNVLYNWKEIHTWGKKRPLIILSVPFNEERSAFIIACNDLVIMTLNYIRRRSVFKSI